MGSILVFDFVNQFFDLGFFENRNVKRRTCSYFLRSFKRWEQRQVLRLARQKMKLHVF